MIPQFGIAELSGMVAILYYGITGAWLTIYALDEDVDVPPGYALLFTGGAFILIGVAYLRHIFDDELVALLIEVSAYSLSLGVGIALYLLVAMTYSVPSPLDRFRRKE